MKWKEVKLSILFDLFVLIIYLHASKYNLFIVNPIYASIECLICILLSNFFWNWLAILFVQFQHIIGPLIFIQ